MERVIHAPALHPFTNAQVAALQGGVNPSAINPVVTGSENQAGDAASIAVHAALTTHLSANERAGVTGALGGVLTAANPALSKSSRPTLHLCQWSSNIDGTYSLDNNVNDWVLPATGRACFLFDPAELIVGFTWQLRGWCQAGAAGSDVSLSLVPTTALITGGVKVAPLAASIATRTENNPIAGGVATAVVSSAAFPAGLGYYQWAVRNNGGVGWARMAFAEILGTPV